jgi:ADP-ribose pyrophosphatase YjhB (NUDIX family)
MTPEDQNKKFIVRTRAVIVHHGKILVVKHSHDHSFYALPGGHVEWAEDIKDSLKREIIEELGIEPKIGRLLFVNNFIEEEIKQSIEFFFEVTNSEDYLNVNKLNGTHSHELAEVCWAGAEDDKNILPQTIQQYLKDGTLLADIVRFL